MNTRLREEQNWLSTISLMIIAFIALAAGLHYTRDVMSPFVLALFITTMVVPIVELQVRHLKIPKPLAVTFALLVVLGAVALIGFLVIGALSTLISTVKDYNASLVQLFKQAMSWLEDWGIKVETERILQDLSWRLPHLATQSAGFFLQFLSEATLTVIFVAFLLAGRAAAPLKQGLYTASEAKIRRYLVTKVVISGATGALVWAILAAFGLRMAPLFGMLAFFLNFIPSLGSIVATILPIPMALVQFEGLWMIVGVVALPGLVQLAIGNILEPKIMGEGLELHPVAILLALAFWGLLWGPVGMVLAVPITASLRIVLMRFETTRPAGLLLAGELS